MRPAAMQSRFGLWFRPARTDVRRMFSRRERLFGARTRQQSDLGTTRPRSERGRSAGAVVPGNLLPAPVALLRRNACTQTTAAEPGGRERYRPRRAEGCGFV
jgi:hypothetical protein